jgi:aspartyl-tRNA(Asn)/glutamyl-tRNA(Gln) amidotransferase subunit A
MQANDLTALSIAEAGALIVRRQVSPVELTDAYLAQLERQNPLLNAYVTVTGDAAREEARAAEREIGSGTYRGPLHGIPIALKDLYDTKGVRTAAGSKILWDRVPDEDSAVTTLLRAAGAISLGKTNTHEFAYGVTTNNPHFGATRNPWNPDCIPGGSSGGSGAAVAAGMAAMAMGSDTGGSIRIPAALCGTVGLKATHGRVSTAGVIPLSWTLDHAGPLTRTVEDAALVLNAIAGYDPNDAMTVPMPVDDYTRDLAAGVRGLRLGVPRAGFFEAIDPEVARAVEEAIGVYRTLGATVEDMDGTALWNARQAVSDIMLADARHYHAAWLRDRPEEYGEDVRDRLMRRTDMSADEFIAAMRVRAAVTVETARLMTRYDGLLLPTTRIPAPPIAGQTIIIDGQEVFAPNILTSNTNPFNLPGMPALSLPCGFTAAGLPIGLQVVTRRWDEVTALRIAAAYERATNWHTRRPAMAESA